MAHEPQDCVGAPERVSIAGAAGKDGCAEGMTTGASDCASSGDGDRSCVATPVLASEGAHRSLSPPGSQSKYAHLTR